MVYRFHGENARWGKVTESRERITIRREVVQDKSCPVCGRIFEGLRRQKYCSVNCANRASYARHADKRRAEKREQYQRRKQGGDS